MAAIRGKSFILVVSVLMLSCGLVSCERESGPAVNASERTLDFTLRDSSGADYNFYDETAGKVVILNFWAERCPACKVELPNLVALYNEYRDDGLIVIGVDVDGRGVSSLANVASEYGVTYPLLTGNMAELSQVIRELGGFRFIPTTYVMGRDGNIVDKASGPKGKAYFEEAIRDLL